MPKSAAGRFHLLYAVVQWSPTNRPRSVRTRKLPGRPATIRTAGVIVAECTDFRVGGDTGPRYRRSTSASAHAIGQKLAANAAVVQRAQPLSNSASKHCAAATPSRFLETLASIYGTARTAIAESWYRHMPLSSRAQRHRVAFRSTEVYGAVYSRPRKPKSRIHANRMFRLYRRHAIHEFANVASEIIVTDCTCLVLKDMPSHQYTSSCSTHDRKPRV